MHDLSGISQAVTYNLEMDQTARKRQAAQQLCVY